MNNVDHAVKLHELPDEYLADALPVAKKIALALGVENYNLLQVRVAFNSALTKLHFSNLFIYSRIFYSGRTTEESPTK